MVVKELSKLDQAYFMDKVEEVFGMRLKGIKVGMVMTGSHCTMVMYCQLSLSQSRRCRYHCGSIIHSRPGRYQVYRADDLKTI